MLWTSYQEDHFHQAPTATIQPERNVFLKGAILLYQKYQHIQFFIFLKTYWRYRKFLVGSKFLLKLIMVTKFTAWSPFFAKILLLAWDPTGHIVPTCHHNFHVWSDPTWVLQIRYMLFWKPQIIHPHWSAVVCLMALLVSSRLLCNLIKWIDIVYLLFWCSCGNSLTNF